MGMLGKSDPVTAWTGSLVLIGGCVTIPSGTTLTTVNSQINPANIGVPPNPGTSNLNSWGTIYPQTMRASVFLNPNGSVAASSENTSCFPRGGAGGATGTLGSELLLDLSGYNADIIFADAEIRTNARGAVSRAAYVSAIDNINKLVYIQIQSQAGSAVSIAVGDTLSFEVWVKDSAGI